MSLARAMADAKKCWESQAEFLETWNRYAPMILRTCDYYNLDHIPMFLMCQSGYRWFVYDEMLFIIYRTSKTKPDESGDIVCPPISLTGDSEKELYAIKKALNLARVMLNVNTLNRQKWTRQDVHPEIIEVGFYFDADRVAKAEGKSMRHYRYVENKEKERGLVYKTISLEEFPEHEKKLIGCREAWIEQGGKRHGWIGTNFQRRFFKVLPQFIGKPVYGKHQIVFSEAPDGTCHSYSIQHIMDGNQVNCLNGLHRYESEYTPDAKIGIFLAEAKANPGMILNLGEAGADVRRYAGQLLYKTGMKPDFTLNYYYLQRRKNGQ